MCYSFIRSLLFDKSARDCVLICYLLLVCFQHIFFLNVFTTCITITITINISYLLDIVRNYGWNPFFLNVLKRDSFLVNNAHFSRFVQMKGCNCVPTETVDAVAWCAGTFWLASIYCSICFSNNKFAFDNLSSCSIFTVFVYTICGSKYAPYVYSKRM